MTDNKELAEQLDRIVSDIESSGWDHYPEITGDDLYNIIQFAHKLRTLKVRKL